MRKPVDKTGTRDTIRRMQSGSAQFDDWMRRRGFKAADAARYLGFTKSYMSLLLSGDRSPGLENAVHIEELTGIPVNAWVATKVDETESAAQNDTFTNGKPHAV